MSNKLDDMVAVCVNGDVVSETATPYLRKNLEAFFADLLAENARLDQALFDTAAQLTDAVQLAQEAEYNLHLMKQQADAFHAENAALREQLRKAHITTVARRFSGDMDCEGDGSGPGCENPVAWEIQAMDDGGSQYAYVCADHLSDYQRWANGDGRLPMVFKKKF